MPILCPIHFLVKATMMPVRTEQNVCGSAASLSIRTPSRIKRALNTKQDSAICGKSHRTEDLFGVPLGPKSATRQHSRIPITMLLGKGEFLGIQPFAL